MVHRALLYRRVCSCPSPWAVCAMVYVLTGVVQPTLTDIVRYSGGGGGHAVPPLMLTLLASTLGMAIVPVGTCIASRCRRDLRGTAGRLKNAPPLEGGGGGGGSKLSRPDPVAAVALLILVDLVSASLIQGGLLMVGSGVYVVMYASTTFWTAAIASASGATVLTARQWTAVLLLTGGLVINGHGQLSAAGSDGSGGTTVVGSSIILAGSALHALFFVLAEKLLRPGTAGPSGGPAGPALLAPDRLSGILGQVPWLSALAADARLLTAARPQRIVVEVFIGAGGVSAVGAVSR